MYIGNKIKCRHASTVLGGTAQSLGKPLTFLAKYQSCDVTCKMQTSAYIHDTFTHTQAINMIYIQRLLKVVLMYQVSQVSQVKAKLSKL